MVLNWRSDLAAADGHSAYVAGRYRDGVWSDGWTDVRRCAEATFIAYAPVCGCGWRGQPVAATDEGYRMCRGELALRHAHAPVPA